MKMEIKFVNKLNCSGISINHVKSTREILDNDACCTPLKVYLVLMLM